MICLGPELSCLRPGLALLAALVLAACAPTQVIPAGQPQLQIATIDPVAQALVASAERTSAALARLSEVESTRTPIPDPGQLPPILPPGLDRPITLEWIGPAEPLVARLASMAEYEFRTVGKRPAVPLVVDVAVENAAVVEVLREVGFQIGARANVTVDADLRVVEVRYAQ